MQKKTKIVCTIGPASWDPAVLAKMVDAGMNVARINGAFADLEELERVEKMVREISTEVALMLDIKGHEVRLNKFAAPIPVKVGDVISIGNMPRHEVYAATYPDLYKDLKDGDKLVFDDGNLEATVVEIKSGVIKAKVTYGSALKPGKSINTPGIHLSNPAITEKDKEQIRFCSKRDWEFVAASFIRTREDAQAVVDLVKGTHSKVIAKIEDQQGVDNFDEILQVVEGIMVARGDLAVEIPFERIPIIQKVLVRKCNELGKPVIVATQMLESMTEAPKPTRAEITDVANAVIDGADAVMLSGESSAGKYPVEAVATMAKIAKEVEQYLAPRRFESRADAPVVTDALVKAAAQVALELGDELKAIVIATMTGRTARLLGRFMLKQPIYAFVSQDVYKRRMMLSRGIVQCITLDKSYHDRDAAIKSLVKEIAERKLVNKHDKVLIVGSSVSNASYFPNIFEVVSIADFEG